MVPLRLSKLMFYIVFYFTPGKWSSGRRRNSPRLYAKTFAMYHRDERPSYTAKTCHNISSVCVRTWSAAVYRSERIITQQWCHTKRFISLRFLPRRASYKTAMIVREKVHPSPSWASYAQWFQNFKKWEHILRGRFAQWFQIFKKWEHILRGRFAQWFQNVKQKWEHSLRGRFALHSGFKM